MKKANRQILHLLLAVLLVMSQQLGILHALSHWTDVRQTSEQQLVAEADDGLSAGLSAGLALDHNCSQCAAFASLATAIHTPNFSFLPLDYSAPQAGVALPQLLGARTARAYDSRAPPLV
ncbi:hypothetical protein [Pseudoduganella violaceinigra]|uniref:hypothetical protein n=1 Tax=Pseudoduganella violaceinigra TaxID=246602 RepID=UPI00041D8402|nr:hypothetical protein [Pseudoduganella violaceinigra]